MLDTLTREDRLRLMRFICSFAWADLRIQDAEREFISRMMTALELNDDEQRLVHGWVQVPPRAEDVDPTEIPKHHRALFLDAARAVVEADGEIDPGEAESVRLLEELIL